MTTKMKCHICNTDNSINECNHYGLNKTEYKIERHQSPILIRKPEKCYIPMFKFEGGHWCFALPIQTMYLATIADAKKSIEHSKKCQVTGHYKCEYKIAEIYN